MNRLIDSLSASLLKNSEEQSMKAELESLSSRYPFFGPAQVLKAALLKREDSPEYEKQAKLASLYFQHPLWLTVLLEEELPPSTDVADLVVVEPTATDIRVSAEEAEGNLDTETAETNDQLTVAGVHVTEEPAPEPPGPGEVAGEGWAELAEENVDNADPNVATGEDSLPKAEEIQIAESAQEKTGNEEFQQAHTEAVLFEKDSDIPETEQAERPGAEQLQSEYEDGHYSEEEDDENIPVPAIPGLKIEPIDPADANLPAFQPFFTVDYFASQGIEADEKPTDRFGKQLRSFTEWLKTMKKVPQTEIDATPVKAGETAVENLAEASNAQKQVVTETMAEVWLKQGNARQAIEVYRKLSLLNPDKSAYFAALIEKIKA